MTRRKVTLGMQTGGPHGLGQTFAAVGPMRRFWRRWEWEKKTEDKNACGG